MIKANKDLYNSRNKVNDMDIIYTNHAKAMLEKRKIEKIWVEETLKSPDKIEKEERKHYARKKLNGLTIEVIYEIVKDERKRYIKIITIYPI